MVKGSLYTAEDSLVSPEIHEEPPEGFWTVKCHESNFYVKNSIEAAMSKFD